jgi:hypothetical protein
MNCRECYKKVSYWKFRDKPWWEIRCDMCQKSHDELSRKVWFKLGQLFSDIDGDAVFSDKLDIPETKEQQWYEKS